MSTCPRCKAVFRCGMIDGKEDGPCWCMDLPPLPSTAYPYLSGGSVACFCPACLRLLQASGKNETL